MGLSNFPSPAEGGVLPLLVMNTLMSVALLKNKLRSVLLLSRAAAADQDLSEEVEYGRRVSITRYGSLCKCGPAMECCVCLCRFEADEKVSELSCKHFFHKACLDNWFHNHHPTCPLCRSI